MSRKKLAVISVFVAVSFFGAGLVFGLMLKSDSDGKIEIKVPQIAKAIKPEIVKPKKRLASIKANLNCVKKEDLIDLRKNISLLHARQRVLNKSRGCGNGRIDPGEECDDGNSNGTFSSKCNSICATTLCGNGIKEKGEQCDDSNLQSGDGCNKKCQLEICGNGRLDLGEECDFGTKNGTSYCSTSCQVELYY